MLPVNRSIYINQTRLCNNLSSILFIFDEAKKKLVVFQTCSMQKWPGIKMDRQTDRQTDRQVLKWLPRNVFVVKVTIGGGGGRGGGHENE
jgi:hypothetical protein